MTRPAYTCARFAFAVMLATSVSAVLAGPGHDHGDAPAAATAGGPQRLPDGSVFLPKSSQHRLEVRTVVGERSSLPKTVELPAEIRMDPGAGGRVQSALGGRLATASGTLPIVGQKVRAGQILAYVQTVVMPVEAANQRAREAELRAQRVQAVQHLERMRTLSDSVPKKEIDAAQATLAAIEGQLAALGGQTSVREPLIAPLSGVVSAASALAGQIVEPRDVLFEIVDPARLLVEARAFDPTLATDVDSASLAVGDVRIPLEFMGAARTLREQSLPLMFRARGTDLARLAVGQPVKVQVQTKRRIEGVALATSALAKNPSNETVVWVKTAAERFEPRPVRTEPLDGTRVAAVSGVLPGERVVVQGASLLNQIR